MKARWITLGLSIVLTLTAVPVDAAPRLLADLWTGEVVPGSTPRDFVSLGERAVFVATPEAPTVLDGVWSSDGTAAGTFQLLPNVPSRGVVLDDIDRVLVVIDGQSWVSDGTVAGTRFLPVTRPPAADVTPVVSGAHLYFADSIDDLWRVTLDGSEATRTTGFSTIRELAPLPDGRVLVRDELSSFADRLWVSDGVASEILADGGVIRPGFGVVPTGVVYVAPSGDDSELWLTDGTDPVSLGVFSGSPQQPPRSLGDDVLWPIGGRLLHTDGVAVTELADLGTSLFLWLGGDDEQRFFEIDGSTWVSDGTPAGTSIVGGDARRYLGRQGASYVFTVGSSGWSIEVTDGDTPLVEIESPCVSCRGRARWGAPVDSGFVFAAEDQDGLGDELYHLTLPAGPIERITNLSGTLERPGASLGGDLIFAGTTPDVGTEPWITDGTAAGSRVLIDLVTGPATPPFVTRDSAPVSYTVVGDQAYFFADGPFGRQLWRTDGVSVTRLTDDLRPADDVPQVVVVDDDLYFPGSPGSTWVHDTISGETRPIGPDVDFSTGVVTSGRFFAIERIASGRPQVLWAFDGDTATALTTEIDGVGVEVIGSSIAAMPGGRVLFTAIVDGGPFADLWSTAGIEGDSIQLFDGAAGTGAVFGPTVFDGEGLFFVGNGDFDTPIELWRTDGLTAARVATISSGFSARALVIGEALWLVEGFENGVVDVSITDNVDNGFTPLITGDATFTGNDTIVGSTLVFERCSVQTVENSHPTVVEPSRSLRGGVGDCELWIADGSPAGTRRLRAGAWPVDSVPTGDTSTTGTFVVLEFGSLLFAPLGGSAVRELPVSFDSEQARRDHLLIDDTLLFAARHPVLGVELHRSDGTSGGTYLLADQAPGASWASPSGFTRFGDDVLFAADDGSVGEEPWLLPIADIDGPPIEGNALLLGPGGRFVVEVEWQAPDGAEGMGVAVPLTADTGAFYFFTDDNLELMVKVLDGRAINGNWWVYYASLSNVAFQLTVTDTETGEIATYDNPSGAFASRGDVSAFPNASARAFPNASAFPNADPTVRPRTDTACGVSDALCYQNGRFAVSVTWQTADGMEDSGVPVPLAGESGAFWFFDPDNLELLVKVLDGRAINGNWWVFYGSLSNVGFEIRVEDLETGTARTYTNEQGSFASRGDTQAF